MSILLMILYILISYHAWNAVFQVGKRSSIWAPFIQRFRIIGDWRGPLWKLFLIVVCNYFVGWLGILIFIIVKVKGEI